MNAVIYYSDTGESARIARYLADRCGYIALELCGVESFGFENAVLVFPVHCQNIPSEVKAFLKKLTAENLAVVAAYGRRSFGNVLYEVQKNYRRNIVAGAYVPCKHAYLQEKRFEDFERLDVIAEKLKNPAPVKIPKRRKNPFADFLPGFRSRAGVKLFTDENCNNCGICTALCGRGAINCGKPDKKCVRCLKCVEGCPQKALHFSLRAPMRAYLKNHKKDELIIYI